MRKSRRMSAAICVMAVALSLIAQPALAVGGIITTLSYDGCTWRLEWERGSSYGIVTEASEVHDQNGGCHYLTAEVKMGASYGITGPSNLTWVRSPFVELQGGDPQNKGTITTWEHEWTQTTGWTNQ